MNVNNRNPSSDNCGTMVFRADSEQDQTDPLSNVDMTNEEPPIHARVRGRGQRKPIPSRFLAVLDPQLKTRLDEWQAINYSTRGNHRIAVIRPQDYPIGANVDTGTESSFSAGSDNQQVGGVGGQGKLRHHVKARKRHAHQKPLSSSTNNSVKMSSIATTVINDGPQKSEFHLGNGDSNVSSESTSSTPKPVKRNLMRRVAAAIVKFVKRVFDGIARICKITVTRIARLFKKRPANGSLDPNIDLRLKA